MVDKAQENLSKIGASARTILADAGYCTEANLANLESRKDIEGLISTRKEREMRKSNPASSPPRRRSDRYKAMDRKLQNPVGKYIYRLRKRIIELVFGQLKYCRGFTGFALRGLEKVKGEFSLWCIAHNILKIYTNNLNKAVITG